jgi:hypothetical protein
VYAHGGEDVGLGSGQRHRLARRREITPGSDADESRDACMTRARQNGGAVVAILCELQVTMGVNHVLNVWAELPIVGKKRGM